MNVSELKYAEKKELREEINLIKKKLRQNSSGVYLSLGAITIILLLLIILL